MHVCMFMHTNIKCIEIIYCLHIWLYTLARGFIHCLQLDIYNLSILYNCPTCKLKYTHAMYAAHQLSDGAYNGHNQLNSINGIIYMGVPCTLVLVCIPLYMYRNLHCIKTALYHTTSFRLVEAVRVLLQELTLDLNTLDKACYSFAAATQWFNVTSGLHMTVGWDMWHSVAVSAVQTVEVSIATWLEWCFKTSKPWVRTQGFPMML